MRVKLWWHLSLACFRVYEMPGSLNYNLLNYLGHVPMTTTMAMAMRVLYGMCRYEGREEMIFEMIAKHNNNSSSNNNNSVAAAPCTKDEGRTGAPEVHPRTSARSLENQCAIAGLAMVSSRRWWWYGVQYVHAGRWCTGV